MSTLREYFETDFKNTIRLSVTFEYRSGIIEGIVLYDLLSYSAFFSCYIQGHDNEYEYFPGLLRNIENGTTKLSLQGNITLPAAKLFPGVIKVENKSDFEIHYQLLGESVWRSSKNIKSTKRLYLYSETDLLPNEISKLQKEANKLDHNLVFRNKSYVDVRSSYEKPLAFISHDSKDKTEIAKPIANNLISKLCPVWYDEYSLKVGNSLRESIENGLKNCHKCILILSPNFLANDGWTKKEFNSIFTREVIEKTNIILPVWFNVTKEQVYEYSPSLVDTVGLDWNKLGEDEVCRKLYHAIVDS